jgi:hypothetical protein
MHIRKNMIQANEGFKCKNCRRVVEPHTGGSCRNHCPFCLFSLHVDLEVPGDRANECQGLMAPVGVENNKKKGTRIIQVCKECGVKSYNRVAPDDDWDLICNLSRIPQ